MPTRLEPKLFTLLRSGYSRSDLVSDIIAGIVVAVVALPLAIAFGIASGVKPEQGLYTAIVAGFVISLLGGSRVQISGPTGAFIVVIYDIILRYNYEGLAVATFIAGLLLVAMGMARMGILLRYIPYPLTVGFTSGIAIIIFSSQIRDLIGLRVDKMPADFIGKWAVIFEHLHTINFSAVTLSVVTLLILFIWPKITNRIPGLLVALIAVTLISNLSELKVETIGTRFGTVPAFFPSPHLPIINWHQFTELFRPALTIAFLVAIESLFSATVADGMIGARHRSNMELIAQGFANILSPCFQGIPATGALARTATNIKNGAKTPIAGLVHALSLLLILLFFGEWAELIPLPLLAGILVWVSYNMSEWRTFVRIFRCPTSDIAILLITFFLTVLIDLTVAIEVGVVVSAFLFLRRMESTTEAEFITAELQSQIDDGEDEDVGAPTKQEVPPGVEVFELFGPLFFGVVERFRTALQRVQRPPKVLIMRMRNVSAIDASGIQALEDVLLRCKRDGTLLLISGLRPQPLEALRKIGFIEKLGEKNQFPNIYEALARAGQEVNHNVHAKNRAQN